MLDERKQGVTAVTQYENIHRDLLSLVNNISSQMNHVYHVGVFVISANFLENIAADSPTRS